VAVLKYLGKTLTKQNSIHDEIKSRLNSGNACYYAIQNLLSSRLPSKNVIIKTYKTIILLVVLYGCETWALILRGKHSLRVFETTVLRIIFGPKWDDVRGGWRKFHEEEPHKFYSSLNIIRTIKSRRMRWVGHAARMREVRNAYKRKKETTRKT
jgi:hypothetical protein